MHNNNTIVRALPLLRSPIITKRAGRNSGWKITVLLTNNIVHYHSLGLGSPNSLWYFRPFARVTVMTAPDLVVSDMSCRIPSATLSGLQHYVSVCVWGGGAQMWSQHYRIANLINAPL